MKEENKVLVTVSLHHAINDATASVVPILFPILKSLFDLNYTQVGIITGSGLALTLIAQLIIGRLSDGKNCLITLSIGLILIGFSMILLTRSFDFFTLLLFMLIFRLSVSFFHPVGTGWISRVFKGSKVDLAMGIQSGFADFGAFIAVSTTLYISEKTCWIFPLYLWSVVVGSGLLVSVILNRNLSERYLYVRIINKKSMKETFREFFDFLRRIKLLIPCLIISGGAWGVVITYLPLLLNERTTLSLSAIGFTVATWIAVGSLSSFSYGKFSSLISRRNVMILSYFMLGFASISLIFFTNLLILIILIILLGFSLFATYPALASSISNLTDEGAEGGSFGIIFTFQTGGGAILSFIGGILSDLYGISMPFVILGFLSVGISLVLIKFLRAPIKE